jgi:hypothetical protein
VNYLENKPPSLARNKSQTRYSIACWLIGEELEYPTPNWLKQLDQAVLNGYTALFTTVAQISMILPKSTVAPGSNTPSNTTASGH